MIFFNQEVHKTTTTTNNLELVLTAQNVMSRSEKLNLFLMMKVSKQITKNIGERGWEKESERLTGRQRQR